MLRREGSFEPYPYYRQATQDVRRYAVESGSLVTPDGPSPYTIVRMRPFACVLPVLHAGTPHARMVLVRQYRYAVDGWQLEAPAGGIEEGESARDAALRELREESGLLVDELVDLGWTYPSGGSTSERAHLFAARCSGARVGTQLDKGEQIETAYASRQQMEELLQSSDFGHAVSYAAWYRFAARGLLDAWMPQG